MNLVLILSFAAWLIAQVLKLLIDLVRTHKVDFSILTGSGGMPSSHSAVVCACAAAAGMAEGWNSVIFAVAVVIAFVVMYDAANVRKAAGEQAKILNYMMNHWTEMPPDIFGNQLRELLGHTPVQVIAGAVLGVVVGGFGYSIFG
ncbi:MAG: divergent PAP2 family protein [Oscillospiraceae bacterium]